MSLIFGKKFDISFFCDNTKYSLVYFLTCISTGMSAILHPSLSSLVASGVVVRCGGFVRDYGEGGICPQELDEAYIVAELSRECGLLDEDCAFWEQIDEIELSLGETASSLQKKIEEEDAFLDQMNRWICEPEEEATAFLEELDRLSGDPEEDCILDTSSPGYKMMKAMGWENNSPLGCRGEGILEPISTIITMRQPGDFSGLGFEEKDTVVEGEKDEKEIKITQIEANYAVGKSDRGGVYIPRGALKHLKNLLGQKLIGKSFTGKIISKKGKYEWRVVSVV